MLLHLGTAHDGCRISENTYIQCFKEKPLAVCRYQFNIVNVVLANVKTTLTKVI